MNRDTIRNRSVSFFGRSFARSARGKLIKKVMNPLLAIMLLFAPSHLKAGTAESDQLQLTDGSQGDARTKSLEIALKEIEDAIHRIERGAGGSNSSPAATGVPIERAQKIYSWLPQPKGFDLNVNLSSTNSNPNVSAGDNHPIFDTVVADKFSSYNKNTGEWKCPPGKGGIYLCTLMVVIDPNIEKGNEGLDFKINGNTIGTQRIGYGCMPVYIPDNEVIEVSIWSSGNGRIRTDIPTANSTWKMVKIQ